MIKKDDKRRIVVPGMRICAAEEHYVAGPGTYALHGYIYSSLVGFLDLVKKTKNDQEIVSIEVHTPNEETAVPAIGDIVTAKVVSVNPRFAKVLIGNFTLLIRIPFNQ